jgi:hypothetical protein
VELVASEDPERSEPMAGVPDTTQNMERCICGTCPSFPGEGGFYCARGKSGEEVERKGCVCGDCPNFKEFGLSGGYFCAEGAAA